MLEDVHGHFLQIVRGTRSRVRFIFRMLLLKPMGIEWIPLTPHLAIESTSAIDFKGSRSEWLHGVFLIFREPFGHEWPLVIERIKLELRNTTMSVRGKRVSVVNHPLYSV